VALAQWLVTGRVYFGASLFAGIRTVISRCCGSTKVASAHNPPHTRPASTAMVTRKRIRLGKFFSLHPDDHPYGKTGTA